MTFYEWQEWMIHRHKHWCSILEYFTKDLGYHAAFHPKIEFQHAPVKWAGKYVAWRHTCIYNGLYCYYLKHDYDETIAHECCHAYQRVLMPDSSWHGDFFHFLMIVVCGFKDASTYHNNFNKPVLGALHVAYGIYELEHSNEGPSLDKSNNRVRSS